MSNMIYDNIVKSSDGELVAACLKIASSSTSPKINRIVQHLGNQSVIELKREQWESEDFDSSQHTSREGRAVQKVSLFDSQDKQILYVHRNITDPKDVSLFDKATIYGDPFKNGESFLSFVDLAQSALRVVKSKDLGPIVGPDVAAHFAAREEALARLETLLARATGNLVEQRAALDKEYAERREKLEADFATQVTTSNELLAAKEADLASRLSDVETREKEIDARSSRTARRDDRKQILDALSGQNRLEISKETKQRRASVLTAYLCFLAFLIASFSATWLPDAAKLGDSVLPIIRSISGLAIVLTFGFLIRWLNSFASLSAAEDFKLKQLELDVQRGSWLVELYFESLDAGEDSEFPPVLMQRLSTGLFSSEKIADESVTASDALTSALLSTAGKVRLNLAGNEVEFSKQDMKNLSKKEL